MSAFKAPHRQHQATSDDVGRDVVAFALGAPSVHNTQPWAWRIGDRRLDLFADRTRQLEVGDRDGRLLAVSCGAALHYATAAAAAAGWSAETSLLPDPRDRDHLATMLLSAGSVTRASIAHRERLAARVTDRRRFISWPIGVDVLARIVKDVGTGDAWALPVTSLSERVRVELMVSRALSVERSDPSFVAEHRHWTTEASGVDGVPAPNARPPVSEGLKSPWLTRFDDVAAGHLVEDDWVLASPADGLVVIVTRDDSPASWLAAGDVLCWLWAAAMQHGLSLVPMSEVIEVAETRDILRHGVVGDQGYPALLVRIGWQEISRSELPATPRRALDDVLRP